MNYLVKIFFDFLLAYYGIILISAAVCFAVVSVLKFKLGFTDMNNLWDKINEHSDDYTKDQEFFFWFHYYSERSRIVMIVSFLACLAHFFILDKIVIDFIWFTKVLNIMKVTMLLGTILCLVLSTYYFLVAKKYYEKVKFI